MGAKLLDRGLVFSLSGYPVPLTRDGFLCHLETSHFVDTSDVLSLRVRFGDSAARDWEADDVLAGDEVGFEVAIERGQGPGISGGGGDGQLYSCLRTGEPVLIVDETEAWCVVDAIHSPVAVVDIPHALICCFNDAWAKETGWRQERQRRPAEIGRGRQRQIPIVSIADHCADPMKAVKPLLSALAPLVRDVGGEDNAEGKGKERKKKKTIAYVPAGAIPVRTVDGVRGASAATAMSLSDTHAVLYLHSYGSGPGTVVESAVWTASETAARSSRVPSRECGTDPIDVLMRHAIGEETASLPLSGLLNGSKMVFTLGQNLKAEMTLRAVVCDKGGVQTPIEQVLAEALLESMAKAPSDDGGRDDAIPAAARRLSPSRGGSIGSGSGSGSGSGGVGASLSPRSISPRAVRSGSIRPSRQSSLTEDRPIATRAMSDGGSVFSLRIPAMPRRLSLVNDRDTAARGTTKSREEASISPAHQGSPADVGRGPTPPRLITARRQSSSNTHTARDPVTVPTLPARPRLTRSRSRSPTATHSESSPGRGATILKSESDSVIPTRAPVCPSPPPLRLPTPQWMRASPRTRRLSDSGVVTLGPLPETTSAETGTDAPPTRSTSTPVRSRGGGKEESTHPSAMLALPELPVRRRRPMISRSSVHGRRTHQAAASHYSGLSSAVSDATRVAGADQITVIVADDYSVSLDLAVNFVRETGCTRIHAVDDGQGILDTLQELRGQGEDTDKAIVITDINMPGVDGTLATTKLRSNPERYGCPYVAGCTSVPGPLSAEVMARCGMNKFVRKPLTRATIRMLFETAIAEQHAHREKDDK